MAGKLKVGESLREALAAWREFFTTLVWAGLLVGLPASIAGAVAFEADLVSATALVAILELAMIAVLGGIAAHVVDRAGKGGLSAALRATGPQVGRLLFAVLIFCLGLFAGFLALIVPGIYLMAAWAVAFPVVALEGTGAVPALKRSWNLAKGNIWRILAVVLLSTLIAAAISAALLVIMQALVSGVIANVAWSLLTSAIAAPLPAVTAVVLYRRLVEREAELRVADPAEVEAPA